MKKFFLMAAIITSLAITSAATTPVRAGGGDVAAGLIGGLAAGTIIGAAVTAPRYYGPPPVYVAPAPYCYWTRGEPPYGMCTGGCELILPSEFAHNSPR